MKNPTQVSELTVVQDDVIPVLTEPTSEVVVLPEKITERLTKINESLQQAHKAHWEQTNAILNLFIDSTGLVIPKDAKVSFAEDFKSITIEQ